MYLKKIAVKKRALYIFGAKSLVNFKDMPKNP